MRVTTLAAQALVWLGRQGTRAVALSIFAGLSVPALAATLKPHIGTALFVLLAFAFLRVNPQELRKLFVRPALVVTATLWAMLAAPALMSGLYLALGADRIAPGLTTTLVLQASTPPVTVAPAFAALMGLDPGLSLAVLVVSTLVTPLTTPLMADFFIGAWLPLTPLDLGTRLFFFLAGGMGAAAVIRWRTGQPWLEAHKNHIDGLNVVVLFVFAIALMDGVAASVVADPVTVAILLAVSFSVTLFQVALTTLVFFRAGWARAFVLGLAAGHRNMGLVIATAGAALPDVGWLYFSMAQFPIYLLPQILKPIASRMTRDAKPSE